MVTDNLPTKADRIARASMLFFRLNADAMNYTPRSHRGQRAAQLMPLIRAKYFAEDR